MFLEGEAFGPPVPISIPANTDKILARLRLPTSSSIVDRIFHASPGSAYRGV
ncbi:hypothetical protein PGTUg99_023891 [Puccinia graminis f. sp. tritici]|uniref:Uncharacterized protein n=1 Tax=Puccinia graminis f. sp. tritici TaxID=56615 RepID=A0A5B0REI4_PUCGR|nr:hypothetical protein PGTUg99_023891 [Puccinia graminis f. sp. tritici]